MFNEYTHEKQKTAKAEFPGQFDTNSIALCLSFSLIQEKTQHCSLWSDSIHGHIF